MSLNLLHLLGKYLVVSFISITSFLGVGNYSEKNIKNNNSLLENQNTVVNSINYETEIRYSEKLPSNIKKVVQEGVTGLSITQDDQEKIVKEPVNEIVEVGTGAYGISTGRLMGYGPDCKGCSTEGYLACRTLSGEKFSLKHNGIYYEDSEYGSIRILAAQISSYPCGTIVEINKEDGTKFNAIVLDKINTTLPNGQTLMDLAYESQTDKTILGADGLTGLNITFSVQRWGW